MAGYIIQDTTLQGIADKVKKKTGITGTILGSELEAKIDSILTPTDGTIVTRTSSDLTSSGTKVTVPAGYYATSVNKSVATVTQATPSISVSSSGLITASATQSAGYVTSGTKSGTKQLTTQGAQTITPGTSDKTISSGRYLTGTQTIKGDANLKPGNIKSGVSIFGVSGTNSGGGEIQAGTISSFSSLTVDGTECVCMTFPVLKEKVMGIYISGWASTSTSVSTQNCVLCTKGDYNETMASSGFGQMICAFINKYSGDISFPINYANYGNAYQMVFLYSYTKWQSLFPSTFTNKTFYYIE